MNILLGFAGRLSRREYFVLSLILGLVMTMLTLATVFALAPHYIASGTRAHAPPTGMVLITAVVVMPVFLWFSLALQAKRLRDIGWNPAYVLPGWIAAIVVDKVVATVVPALAIGHDRQTPAGALINLAMVGCLLFWPSGPAGGGDWDRDRDRGPADIGRPMPAAAAPAAPARRERPAATAPSGFGRRGLS